MHFLRSFIALRSFWISVATSVFAIVLVWSVIDLKTISFDLGELRIELVFAVLFFSILSLVLSVVRWRLVFDPIDRPSFSACTLTYCLSVLVNIVVPFRGGDIARGYVVATRRDLTTKAASVTSVGIEKLFDLIALLILLILWLGFAPAVDGVVALVLLTAFFTALGFLILFVLHLRSTNRYVQPTGRIQVLLAGLREGGGRTSRAVLDIRSAVPLVFLSLLIRSADALIYLSIGAMIGFSLSGFEALIFGAAIGVAVLIPAAPGFIGTYEAAGLTVLSLFGPGDQNALEFVIWAHLWQLFYGGAIGIIGLLVMRRSFRSVFRQAQ